MLMAKKASNNLTVIERMGLLPGEAIAHAIDRFDIMGRAGNRLDLGAQVLDVQIDGAFVAFKADALQKVEQIEAGIDMSRRGHQGGQQIEFGGGQVDIVVSHLHRMGAAIQNDIGCMQAPCLTGSFFPLRRSTAFTRAINSRGRNGLVM